MTTFSEFVAGLPGYVRVASIALVAVGAHLLVRTIRWGARRLVEPAEAEIASAYRRSPRFVTVTNLLTSTLTFAIYFLAVGFVLREMGVNLTAYLATATVIGLAVGFGSQGVVQDVVIGLTLIFSDVVDVGDVVDLSGQTGRVERIGLRFTTLVNVHEQQVFVPNRTIGLINRYRNGYVRAYVDVQVPEEVSPDRVRETVRPIAEGLREQHAELILTPPAMMGVRRAESGGWRYLRVKFRLWPGQTAIVETGFKQRVLAAMRELEEGYPDWKITVTYRAE